MKLLFWAENHYESNMLSPMHSGYLSKSIIYDQNGYTEYSLTDTGAFIM